MPKDYQAGPNRLPDTPENWPKVTAGETDILAWRDKFFNKDSSYRTRHMERMTTAIHYVLGNHDITFSNAGIHETSSSYTFRKRNLDGAGNDFPNPVTNYTGIAADTEMSALGKRKLVPKVVPNSTDPKTEAAARAATEILDDKLKKLHWQEKRPESNYYFAVCGLVALKTYWDKTLTDTKTVGNPEASACPDCGTKLSTPFISNEQKSGLSIPEFGSRQQEDGNHLLAACPNGACEGILEPYEMSSQEAQEDDVFGRPMGVSVPKGECGLDVITPFELFVENAGVGTTSYSAKIKGQVTPRSMDWGFEHYGDLFKEIEPENPDDMMRWHPILGEWSFIGNYSSTRDSAIYDDHVLVYEVCQEKSYRFPEGRYIVMTKGKVLEDSELYIKVPTVDGKIKEIAKVQYSSAHFKLRPGEYNGKGLPDDLISPQNRLNGIDAQTIDARERMGSPNMLLPESVNVQGPEWWEDWGAGKLLRYEDNPINPGAKPEIFEGTSITGAAFQERQAVLEDLEKLGAPKDLEVGKAPRNITTTSGLKLLKEEGDQLRGDREDALVSMYESAWTHTLNLLAAFRLEEDDDTYEVETSGGSWEEKQISSTVIAGQTKVKIEKQSYIDKSVFVVEAVREAQLDGLYDASTPYSKIKLLEMRGLPTDVNENENLQVKQGRRQWVDFKDESLIPTIDQTLDAPAIRFEVLGTQLLSDDGRDMAEAAGWPEISKTLTGWEDTFRPMLEQDRAARAFYGGVVPPEQGEQMYNEGLEVHEQQLAQYQLDQQAAASLAQSDEQTKMPPTIMEPPPEPPPPPSFMPNAMEDKILLVWQQILEQTGEPLPQANYPETIDPSNPEGAPAAAAQKQQDFIKFRAVVAAYKELADQEIMEQMMGELEAQAPSSQEPGVGPAGPQRPSPFSQPPTPPQTKV